MASVEIIVLAAGQGTRMKSARPKVLHALAGRPLLAHVIDCARSQNPNGVHVVYGHGGEQVPREIADANVNWVLQAEQLGTGHAVDQAMRAVGDDATVAVVYGDVPLLTSETLRNTIAAADRDSLGLLTVRLDDPTGYGRIVRDDQNRVTGIVEHKDANAAQRAITEINTGILAASAGRLRGWLSRLDDNNTQREYYLTDIIAMAVADGVAVNAVAPKTVDEVMGVNDRLQLAHLERVFQLARAAYFMRAGVTLMDPARVDFRGDIAIGEDTVIDVNVVLEGEVEIGANVRIGPNVSISNSRIADNVEILANCVIDGARVGEASRIGPFSRLRPEAVLADHIHVGNFVEIKKSNVASRSKVNHLTYVGDADVGEDVNIGAGTITCNYDGANKHRTTIGDRVFVGSGVELVAPVTVGDDAIIGAGSTISRSAPAEKLTLERAKQTSLRWRKPQKKS